MHTLIPKPHTHTWRDHTSMKLQRNRKQGHTFITPTILCVRESGHSHTFLLHVLRVPWTEACPWVRLVDVTSQETLLASRVLSVANSPGVKWSTDSVGPDRRHDDFEHSTGQPSLGAYAMWSESTETRGCSHMLLTCWHPP